MIEFLIKGNKTNFWLNSNDCDNWEQVLSKYNIDINNVKAEKIKSNYRFIVDLFISRKPKNLKSLKELVIIENKLDCNTVEAFFSITRNSVRAIKAYIRKDYHIYEGVSTYKALGVQLAIKDCLINEENKNTFDYIKYGKKYFKDYIQGFGKYNGKRTFIRLGKIKAE